MISVLIPIYNTDITPLVEEIWRQGTDLGKDFEIVLLDDGSSLSYRATNQKLQAMDFVHYHESDGNQGRARSRNQLVRLSSYPLLLFLDDDSRLIREDFLLVYLNSSRQSVTVGGRVYSKQRPSAETSLHWRYGSQRESRNLRLRRRYAQRYFHSNNFVVPRQLIEAVPFDERLQRYGYEDLLFAKDIIAKGYSIEHIDNAVLHNKLDTNEQFISKHRDAVQSLARQRLESENLGTRLEEAYGKVWPPLLPLLLRCEKFIFNKIPLTSLPLLIFDLRRLAWLDQEIRSSQSFEVN